MAIDLILLYSTVMLLGTYFDCFKKVQWNKLYVIRFLVIIKVILTTVPTDQKPYQKNRKGYFDWMECTSVEAVLI